MGALLVGAKRVGRSLLQALLRSLVTLHAVEGIAEVVGRLELRGIGLQGAVVTLDAAFVIPLVEVAVTTTHGRTLGLLLCHEWQRSKQQDYG